MTIGNYDSIAKVLNEINQNELILIAGHKNSDMDSIASSLALTRYLNKLGKKAICLIEEKHLNLLNWFNDYKYIETTTDNIKEPYNFILVDANEKSRLGIFENLFNKAKTTIQIDHHENNEGIADHILVDTDISSTSEMVYNILKLLKLDIDSNIASLIYAGILNDTCCFTRRITDKTFNITSDLLKYNIDYENITKKTYLNKSLNEIKIIGKVISEVTIDNDTAYVIIDKSKNTYKDVDYNTFSKKILTTLNNINDINIVVGILIDNEKTEIIMRSHTIEIESILKSLGGGGHKYAAGATVYNKNPSEVINTIKDKINSLKGTPK